MSYVLFLLVNAVLFLRPAEIFPEVRGISFYEYLILACLVFALPEVLRTLFGQPVEAQPITLCVLGVLVGVVMSQVATLNFAEAGRTGVYFLKVVVYYILLISILNTPQRLRGFMRWIVCFCVVLTTMTILQYYEVISLQALKPLTDVDSNSFGESYFIKRLQGTGIFQDPNEFCLMQAVAIPLALFLLTDPRAGAGRMLWLGPIALFMYAIQLTHSRGGFLAFVAGLGVTAWCRLGTQRTMTLALLGLPVLFVLFAGRQTDFSASRGTGQTRVQIWSDYLQDFRDQPLFGKGMDLDDMTEGKTEKAYSEEKKRVAHNSYLHAFTELGFFGGIFFLGGIFFAVLSLYRIHTGGSYILDLEQQRVLPFFLGTVAALAVGMLSLSLCYVVPTYLVLGMTAAYVRVTPVYPPLPPLRFDGKRLGQIIGLSIGFLAFVYVFVRVFRS
jgi:hypothetical protein